MLRLFSQFLDALKSVPDSGFFQLFSFASGAAAKIVLSWKYSLREWVSEWAWTALNALLFGDRIISSPEPLVVRGALACANLKHRLQQTKQEAYV